MGNLYAIDESVGPDGHGVGGSGGEVAEFVADVGFVAGGSGESADVGPVCEGVASDFVADVGFAGLVRFGGAVEPDADGGVRPVGRAIGHLGGVD